MGTDPQLKNDRKAYLDHLRILATFAVILLHISGSEKGNADVNSVEWQVLNFIEGIVRWGVPVFVMISGALFLNKDIPVKRVYSRYISRMIIAFFSWSLVYAIILKGTIYEKLHMFICGDFHMWFILMIIGVYMCIPFIRLIVSSDAMIKYYLLLAFIFAFTIPEMINLANSFGNETVVILAEHIELNVGNMNISMVLGYVSIFILGFYLDKLRMSRKELALIYIMGAMGFLFTVLLASLVSLKTQQNSNVYFGYHTVNVLFEAVFIFVLIKNVYLKCEKINLLISKMSKYCFGIYLVHPLSWALVRKMYDICGIDVNYVPWVFITSIAVFAISYLVSMILNSIPYVGKYVV